MDPPPLTTPPEVKAIETETSLWWAAENGANDVVVELLDNDETEPKRRNHLGETPLSLAAKSGHEVVVKLLLDSGKVEVNSKDSSGATPLIQAAKNGYEGIVELLLGSGADPNLDDGWRAPLWWATYNGHEEVVKTLLEFPNIKMILLFGQTPLHVAAEKGHGAIVRLLLSCYGSKPESKDEFGQTPLFLAARNGHQAITELLLRITVPDKDLYASSIQSAAENGHDMVVKLLLASGADMDPNEGQLDRKPLYLAAKNGHNAVVKILLGAGADPTTCDLEHWSPFSVAALFGHEAVVEMFLDTGLIDVNSRGKDEMTPLYLAARYGHEAVVKLLLVAGADPNLGDAHCSTPLLSASRNGHRGVVELLLGTNLVTIDAKTDENLTSLYWAARNGHKVIVDLLLASGKVSVETKHKDNRTPLFWAAKNGHEAIVRRMLEIDQVDSSSTTLYDQMLWEVTKGGHDTVLKLLFDNGKINLNTRDQDDCTPLWYGAKYGRTAVVRFLLETGNVDPDPRGRHGETPLLCAAREGYTAIAKLLIDTSRVTPDLRCQDSKTPLWWAAKNGHKAIVKLLLETHLVDPNTRDGKNTTPLWWAAKNGYRDIVKLMLNDDDIDVNISDEGWRRTPLSLAARNKDQIIMNLLLQSGKADLCLKDVCGVPPLWWNLQSSHRSAREWLSSNGKKHVCSDDDISIEVDHRCLAHWLDVCDTQHRGCFLDTLKQGHHHNPDWVIDTDNGCIVPGQNVPQYVALSYVWKSDQEGEDNLKRDVLLLNETSLSQFQVAEYLHGPISESLPRVIKDAMHLVRKLGLRYMWADRLCIVQDGEEKQSQVARMNEIYSNAHLTIIAATSSGLFDKPRNAGKPKNLGHSVFSDPRSEYIETLYDNLLKTKWATRGWTFQEHILARRAVVFTDEDMFWDCQISLWDKDELLPGISIDEDEPVSRPHYEMARRMSTTSWPDFAMYIEMVGLYNGRDLTYPQDALPAISGVLNLMGRNFPSGFVGGLPRLFLDIALLWQPFHKAKRRQPEKEANMIERKSCLPSWSWCGWQCLVDPWSLRAGLAYLDREDCQTRASTWRTRRLVQWSVLSDSMELKKQVDEPAILQSCVDLSMNEDALLPDGWTRHSDSQTENVYFKHASDPKIRFKHPVPIKDAISSTPSIQTSWQFLSCKTERTFFTVGAILQANGWLNKQAGMKTSVFELPQFTNGPDLGDICDIICLEDKYGRSAGQLRRMDTTEVGFGNKIELVAISTGSVSFGDLSSSFEEVIDRNQCFSYRHGLKTIFFKRVTQENDPGTDGIFPTIRASSGVKVVAASPQKANESEGEYQFYNVLWIEREGEIAYRKAAGRVPKAIWEDNCPEPIDLILG